MIYVLIIYSIFITIKFLIYKAGLDGLCKYVADNYDDDIKQEDLEECTRYAVRKWFRK